MKGRNAKELLQTPLNVVIAEVTPRSDQKRRTNIEVENLNIVCPFSYEIAMFPVPKSLEKPPQTDKYNEV